MNILITGSESSGTVLVSKIIAHVLNVKQYDTWGGYEECRSKSVFIHHVSLPTDKPPKFIPIEGLIKRRTHIVITTRDINISTMSKIQRWNRKPKQAEYEIKKAYEMISDLLNQDVNYFILNYETLMALKLSYLKLLYKWLGVDSDFVPKLINGNEKYYDNLLRARQ